MRPSTKQDHTERTEMAVGMLLAGEPGTDVQGLADKTAVSRFHFQRLFKSVMGETPGELRRRLLLERAAWQLQSSTVSVTEIAFEAEYQSLEGFTRSFTKAFGLSPSRYRRTGPPNFRLAAECGLHYSPVVGALPLSLTPKGETMDLIDRLLDHDYWLTRRMLERAETLGDEKLDKPFATPSQATSFESEQKTLRDLLDRVVFTKEVWVAALEHQEFPSAEREKSIRGLISRLEIAGPTFITLAKRVRDQNKWDETFVDELCEPPETFSFGGMISHVLTFNTFRRQLALEIMRKMGVEDLGYGDPIEWERQLT